MKSIIYSLTLILLLTSCDDCKDISCFTPPPSFSFEIVDKQTEENLFTNGTYSEDQIQVFNTLTNNPIDYTFIGEEDINIINIFSLGWETEEVDVTIKIGEDIEFNFFVDAERKNEDCCSFTEINEFSVENIDYALLQFSPYAVTILVEN
ncbi:MAG: hypothetical protein ABFR32_12170 [Bacteroidota bacterium]